MMFNQLLIIAAIFLLSAFAAAALQLRRAQWLDAGQFDAGAADAEQQRRGLLLLLHLLPFTVWLASGVWLDDYSPRLFWPLFLAAPLLTAALLLALIEIRQGVTLRLTIQRPPLTAQVAQLVRRERSPEHLRTLVWRYVRNGPLLRRVGQTRLMLTLAAGLSFAAAYAIV